MTQNEKNKIIELRNQGKGYGEIAKELGISKSTVSTFLSRSKIEDNNYRYCKQCGEKITTDNTKTRIFCCYECRDKWWNNNRDKLKSKDKYKFKCIECGTEFISYKHVNQKFCSRECYIKHRFKGGASNE